MHGAGGLRLIGRGDLGAVHVRRSVRRREVRGSEGRGWGIVSHAPRAAARARRLRSVPRWTMGAIIYPGEYLKEASEGGREWRRKRGEMVGED